MAMEARKGLLGEDGAKALDSAHQLARVYLEQKKWELARTLEDEVLNARRRTKGENHPDTLDSMSFLAWAYWGLGRLTEAQILEEEVVDATKRILKMDHPHTLQSIHNLSATYRSHGLLDKAELLADEVVGLRSELLGRQHPHTLVTMCNLGGIYLLQGRLSEAEELLKEVVESRSKVLGEHHPHTLLAMNDLAATYVTQRRWEEADILMNGVMEHQKAHGLDIDLTTTLNTLAIIQGYQGNWPKARELMKQVVEGRRRMLVKRRPSVTRHHTTTGASLSPPRNGLSPPRNQTLEASLLSRVLAEEDRVIARLREQVSELATELRVRTEALESAYGRVQTADKRTVETHQKYLAEAAARGSAESETRRAHEETRKVQMLLEVAQNELSRSKREIEHLEAEKAEAESAAGRARTVARELKQTMRVNKAREVGIAEGRAGITDIEERLHKEEMAAAVKEAFEKGRVEGEASATIKALAAFDKLMASDDLDDYDEKAKQDTRQEIVNLSKSPEPKASDMYRAKSPSPPRRKWSIRRTPS
ncbi:hypothetical protein FRC07_000797 [Ceratobasidium sp. 392]|nr:hypothetical protein FRC07_000797 [Ceratobasidium sp. 392]